MLPWEPGLDTCRMGPLPFLEATGAEERPQVSKFSYT